MAENTNRVALFYWFLGGGGIERVLLNLANGLINRGLSVDLVLGKASGPHISRVPSRVRIIDLESKGKLELLTKLIKYLKQEKPTTLLSAGHPQNEIAVCAKYLAGSSTHVVVREANILSKSLKHKSWARRSLTPLFIRSFYPLADGIITLSNEMTQDLVLSTKLASNKIHMIYNPIDIRQIREKAGANLDHPWFLPGEPPVILGVGKLEPQKDFATLIHAFAQVRHDRASRLLILGWGPQRPALESLVRKLGLEDDVSMPGWVENPYVYMSKAALFVLSSAWEGLPNVLIEAMALGKPVVSTNCKSGPSELLANGKYGTLTPVGDSSSLATAIQNVLSGQTRQIDPSWIKQFDLDFVTEQYAKVLGV
jgi:glycosyltransferase involved in cell wall biosynthesis